MDELKSLADELYGLSIEVESEPANKSINLGYALEVIDERQMIIIKALRCIVEKMIEDAEKR
jgi:hypothetical protein